MEEPFAKRERREKQEKIEDDDENDEEFLKEMFDEDD